MWGIVTMMSAPFLLIGIVATVIVRASKRS